MMSILRSNSRIKQCIMDKEQLSLAFWAVGKMIEYRAANKDLTPLVTAVYQKDENGEKVRIGNVIFLEVDQKYIFVRLTDNKQ